MENANPFKELESDAVCPPRLKAELLSEIDLIRDIFTVVEQHVGDLLGTAIQLVDPPHQPTRPA